MIKKNISFANLSEHFQNVFETEEKFEACKNLMFDLGTGKEIYDAEEDRVISKAEAEDKLRKIQLNLFGLNENSTKRERKRAFKKYKDEWFEVTEEVIDYKVETGFKESEFFNTFVEERNISRGDSIEFWTEDDVVLSVVKVAGDHHDFN